MLADAILTLKRSVLVILRMCELAGALVFTVPKATLTGVDSSVVSLVLPVGGAALTPLHAVSRNKEYNERRNEMTVR